MIKYYFSPFENIINDGLEFVIIWKTSVQYSVAKSFFSFYIKYQYLTLTFTEAADVIILQVWLVWLSSQC